MTGLKPQEMALIRLTARPHLLWANVTRGPGCWEWNKSVNASGYGAVRCGPSSILAHRAAFFLRQRYLALDGCVCHSCDNPRCCNPDHLFLSDHADNMADMRAKGRRRGITVGVRNGRAKLTHESAQRIRAERAGTTLKTLSERYQVSISTIGRVCKGENWNA